MKTLFTGSKSMGSDARRTRWGVLGSSLAALTLLAAPLAIDIGSNGASGLIGSANAAPGGIPGPPDGGGGTAPDFGDLIILLRDDNGVPIPSPETLVPDPETGLLVDGGLCWQPIAFNVDDETLCPADCVVDSVPTGTAVVDVDQFNCAVATGCSGCTQEVDFGRINEARSPDEVLASQLEDVVVTLATADQVTLDPAGRLVASTCDSTLDNLAKTIDSPLQNLSIYRQLMLTGTIGTPLPEGAGVFDTAARGLGAASDKSGGVNVDLVHYLNQIMGLDDVPTFIGKLCETYREEVQGVIQLVEKCFLNYGPDPSDIEPAGADYAYTRSTNFGALPAPAYIPEGLPEEGWFEYLVQLTSDPDPDTFGIAQGPILNAVFCVDLVSGDPVLPLPDGSCPDTIDPGFLAGNVGGFAQASDDARAVINFMHTWQVPVTSETPVPCVPSDDIFYDLSISEQSGLQVPKNYVNGGEREFFVNVGNLGPDPANGTVTVVATNGGTLGSWTFTFTDLPAGQTASFTQLFTIDTASDTINWNATVVADPPGTDPNPGNNSVDAVSSVRAAGGGGGNPN